MRFLVSGTLSGLGRYAHERLGGAAWTRDSGPRELAALRRRGVDVILHCAANASRGTDGDSVRRSLEDNVMLTYDLCSIPHRKFVLMSSVDVYPKNGEPPEGLYAAAKLMSEAVVRSLSKNHLIVRASSLLGPYSRKNSLIKIIEDRPAALSLSGDSRLNYVLHADVLDFILTAVQRDLKGVYNAASSTSITLRDAARLLGRRVRFGRHRYDVGRIDNRRIAAVCPAFRRTSRQAVQSFLAARGAA